MSVLPVVGCSRSAKKQICFRSALCSQLVRLLNVSTDDGNCDYRWGRAITTLCNPGELFITEDWTYPSALANSQPYGILPVGVPMDDQGMRPDALRKLLAEWDEVARGHKRYVVFSPIGQCVGSKDGISP